jgi:hypothetical protein
MTENGLPGGHEPPKKTRSFRKYVPSVRFTALQAQRQNELIRSAWKSLASKEAVIAFLNTKNEKIGGQPLMLALESADGLRTAQELLEGFRDEPGQ